ncbi:hypothetical protein [methane-oxidizing endosymbiont of Gigantopelta aegis]|uniref:hypothetical protein n=1 Tax=methane-oxidizing endosymbiont of Gigantopelta aegis TaxID=2794938 RepID=UPI0018DCA4ED|nr:hypothetical protein [methane-oxidizing endosymbiont of Gigantopelta aegis]
MDIKKEFEEIAEKLKQERDELKVQLHLASMEVKEEWEKAEKKWEKVADVIEDVADDTKETAEDVIEAAKVIGDELSAAYKRITERLKHDS